jgi:hypothetical protein
MATKKVAPVCADTHELEKIIRLVSDDRKHIAKKLAHELIFMGGTLDDLKTTVKGTGAVDLFEQGRQSFMRESPALKAYNTTIQRYSLLFKQLTDMLPKQAQDNADSTLFDFIKHE